MSQDAQRSKSYLTPAQRSMLNRINSGKSWLKTTDRSARTAPAREAFDGKFADQADPDRSLRGAIEAAEAAGDTKEAKRLEADLARRIETARKIHFTELALRSSLARSQRAASA